MSSPLAIRNATAYGAVPYAPATAHQPVMAPAARAQADALKSTALRHLVNAYDRILGTEPSANYLFGVSAKASPPNLKVLRPSRKRLAPGDIFAMLPPDGRYVFGRVISTEASWGPSLKANMIYVFNVRSDTKTIPDRSDLRTESLLFAPAVINRLPWSRGYFETIGHVPFGEGEVLKQHCFEDSGHRFFDEAGRQVQQRTEPCGFRGLHSFRTIDDLVSEALGIPLASD